MSKVYNTDEKHVRITNRPETLLEDHGNENDEVRIYKEQQTFSTKNSYPAWSPIDQKFFMVDESDSDEDDDDQQTMMIESSITDQLIQFEHVEEELEWDNSPEQYAIWNTYNTEDFQSPSSINEKLEENTDTTSSHEEVFLQDPLTPPKNPKLRRRNAMRRKQNKTEPRMTRNRLSLGMEQESKSQPTSPSTQGLLRCRNLASLLRPRHPQLPETVVTDRVQHLDVVLPIQDEASAQPRRLLRKRPKIDYLKLHNGGE